MTTKRHVIDQKQVIFYSLIMAFLMCNNSPSSFFGIILNHNQPHLLAQQLAHVVLITPPHPRPCRHKESVFVPLLPSFTDSQGGTEVHRGRKNEGDQVSIGGCREEQNKSL